MRDQCRANARAVVLSGSGPRTMKWLFPCTRIPSDPDGSEAGDGPWPDMGVRNLLLWKLYTSNGTEGEPRLAEVHIQDGETLESALRRFKRKVLQEEIIREIKRHSSYLKPGEKKRVKAALARKRNRKKRSRDSAIEPSR